MVPILPKLKINAGKKRYGFFNQWGIPTAISIIEASSTAVPNLNVIGSGGIQNSLDIAKGISIGADAIGMSGVFLRILLEEGAESLQKDIETLHTELAVIMAALGARTISQLQKAPLIITGQCEHWLTQRGIDTKSFSQRNKIE